MLKTTLIIVVSLILLTVISAGLIPTEDLRDLHKISDRFDTYSGRARRSPEDIGEQFDKYTKHAKEKAGEMGEQASEKAKEVSEQANQKAKKVSGKEKRSLSEKTKVAVNNVSEKTTEMKNTASEKATEVKNKAGELGEKAKHATQEAIGKTKRSLGDKAEEAKDVISEKATEAKDKAGEMAEKVIDRTVDFGENVKHKTQEVSGRGRRSLDDDAKKAKNAVSEKATEMKNTVKESAAEAKEKAGEMTEKAKNTFSRRDTDSIKENYEEMKEKLMDTADEASETANKYDEMKGDANEKVKEMKDNAEEKYDYLAVKAGELKDKVEDKYRVLSDKVHENYSEASDKADELKNKAIDKADEISEKMEKIYKKYLGEHDIALPYITSLTDELAVGHTIHTIGTLNENPIRVDFNFQKGAAEGVDLPLHISIRFDEGIIGSGKLVYNTFQNGNWSETEQRISNPFAAGEEFDLRVRILPSKFQVFANRQEVGFFEQRLPLDGIDTISIQGDLAKLRLFHYGGQIFSQPCTAKTEIVPGKRLDVSGFPKDSKTYININLYRVNKEYALQVSIRYDEGVIVRNAMTEHVWGEEERNGKMPLTKNHVFDISIINEETGFIILVNGEGFATFGHRGSNMDIKTLEVEGDVDVHSVTINDAV